MRKFNKEKRGKVLYSVTVSIIMTLLIIALIFISHRFIKEYEHIESIDLMNKSIHFEIDSFILNNNASKTFKKELEKYSNHLIEKYSFIEAVEIYQGELLGIKERSFVLKNSDGVIEISGHSINYSDLTNLKFKNDIIFKIIYKPRSESRYSIKTRKLYLIAKDDN